MGFGLKQAGGFMKAYKLLLEIEIDNENDSRKDQNGILKFIVGECKDVVDKYHNTRLSGYDLTKVNKIKVFGDKDQYMDFCKQV